MTTQVLIFLIILTNHVKLLEYEVNLFKLHNTKFTTELKVKQE